MKTNPHSLLTKATLILCFVFLQSTLPAQKIGGEPQKDKIISIDKDYFKNTDSLITIVRHLDYPLTSNISRFKMSMYRRNLDPVEYVESDSGLITPTMKKYLDHLTGGEIIYFEYIKATSDDGAVRNLPPLSFKVK